MPKEMSDDIRDRLLLAFDATLEPALLYPEERAEHLVCFAWRIIRGYLVGVLTRSVSCTQRAVEQVLTQEQRFADIYGPAHLLRFLMLLTQSPTLSLLESDDSPTEVAAGGSKRRRELGKKHEDAATEALHKLAQDIMLYVPTITCSIAVRCNSLILSAFVLLCCATETWTRTSMSILSEESVAVVCFCSRVGSSR